MTQWIYCATDEQVGAEGTQELVKERGAIWCPPPGLRPWPREHPQAGDRLWLTWSPREELGDASPVSILGVGTLRRNPEERYNTHLVWTSRDVDNLVELAERLGYRGGAGMSFLLLDDVRVPESPKEVDLGHLDPRFNEATKEQIARLEKVLPVD